TGINPTQPPSWETLPELIDQQGSFRLDGSPIHQVGTVLTGLPEPFGCGDSAASATGLYQGLSGEARGHAVVYDSYVTNVIGKAPTCLTAQQMNALFWTPVLAGASGIEYITQGGG